MVSIRDCFFCSGGSVKNAVHRLRWEIWGFLADLSTNQIVSDPHRGHCRQESATQRFAGVRMHILPWEMGCSYIFIKGWQEHQQSRLCKEQKDALRAYSGERKHNLLENNVCCCGIPALPRPSQSMIALTAAVTHGHAMTWFVWLIPYLEVGP